MVKPYKCCQSPGHVKQNLNKHAYCAACLVVKIIQRWICFLCQSPWYNRRGWPSVTIQLSILCQATVTLHQGQGHQSENESTVMPSLNAIAERLSEILLVLNYRSKNVITFEAQLCSCVKVKVIGLAKVISNRLLVELSLQQTLKVYEIIKHLLFSWLRAVWPWM